MLHKRILAATAMISLLSLALWADLRHFHDSVCLHGVFMLGAFFSFREFWPMCRATGHQTFSVWGTFSGCMLVICHYFSMRLATHNGSPQDLKLASDLSLGALAAAMLGTFALTARRHKFEASIGGVAVTCLGLLYIFFLPSFVLKLRHIGLNGLLGGPVENWNLFGHHMVVATIVLAKGCDVWAYAVGRLFGKNKVFPHLSPGKTWEGVAGGLLGSIAVGAFLWWEPIGILSYFSLAKAMSIGLCIGFAGIMGDLTESLLKRSAGAKDAGHIVPGYGGTMDVVDSLMVAGPVAYFLIPAML